MKMPRHIVKKTCLSIMLFFLLMLIGSNKAGFHVDEMYTFGLSNHQYDGSIMPSINIDKVYSGNELWREYTAVSLEHRFDYNNVFANQKADVHPPLYYMLIHTICSLFPETLGMWMGLLVNVILAIIVYWQLYWLFTCFIKEKRISLLFALFFVLGMGFINNLVFFRMYMLLSVWTNCLLILFCNNRVEEKADWKYCISLAMIIWGGLMTQYYFAIFTFFSCIVYACYVVIQKNWKKFILSAISIGVGVGLAIFTFPSMLRHIFLGNRGTEAFQNAFHNLFFDALWTYMDALDLQVFGGLFVIIAVALCVLYIVNVQAKKPSKETVRKYVQVTIPAIGYLMVVIQIAPYRTERYVMNIMAILYLIVFSLLIKAALRYSKQAIKGVIIIAVLVLFGSYRDGVPCMQTQEKNNIAAINEKGDPLCLYVYTSDLYTWKIMPNYLEMASLNQIVFINNEKFNEANWNYFKGIDQLLVFVMSDIDSNIVFDKLKEINPGLDDSAKLFSYGYATAYFVE